MFRKFNNRKKSVLARFGFGGRDTKQPTEKEYNDNMVRLLNLTKTELWKLRNEIRLGSLYVHEYRNSFKINPYVVCEFFDWYEEFLRDENMNDDIETLWGYRGDTFMNFSERGVISSVMRRKSNKRKSILAGTSNFNHNGPFDLYALTNDDVLSVKDFVTAYNNDMDEEDQITVEDFENNGRLQEEYNEWLSDYYSDIEEEIENDPGFGIVFTEVDDGDADTGFRIVIGDGYYEGIQLLVEGDFDDEGEITELLNEKYEMSDFSEDKKNGYRMIDTVKYNRQTGKDVITYKYYDGKGNKIDEKDRPAIWDDYEKEYNAIYDRVIKEINERLADIAKNCGLKKYSVAAKFSNGETMYVRESKAVKKDRKPLQASNVTMKKEFTDKVRKYVTDVCEEKINGFGEEEIKDFEKELGISFADRKGLNAIKFIYELFKAEKGYEIKRIGAYRAFIDWLQGLALPMEFDYNSERKLLKEWFGQTDEESNKYSDDKVDSQYWHLFTREFFKLLEKASKENKNDHPAVHPVESSKRIIKADKEDLGIYNYVDLYFQNKISEEEIMEETEGVIDILKHLWSVEDVDIIKGKNNRIRLEVTMSETLSDKNTIFLFKRIANKLNEYASDKYNDFHFRAKYVGDYEDYYTPLESSKRVIKAGVEPIRGKNGKIYTSHLEKYWYENRDEEIKRMEEEKRKKKKEKLEDKDFMDCTPKELLRLAKRCEDRDEDFGLSLTLNEIVEYTIDNFKKITGYSSAQIFDGKGYKRACEKNNDYSLEDTYFWNQDLLNDSGDKIVDFWNKLGIDVLRKYHDFWENFDYSFRERFIY